MNPCLPWTTPSKSSASPSFPSTPRPASPLVALVSDHVLVLDVPREQLPRERWVGVGQDVGEIALDQRSVLQSVAFL